MEGTESKLVGRGCSVVVGVAGSRSLSMDAPLFVESDSVRNDGVDAHRARGVSLFRLRQQQQHFRESHRHRVFVLCLLPSGFTLP